MTAAGSHAVTAHHKGEAPWPPLKLGTRAGRRIAVARSFGQFLASTAQSPSSREVSRIMLSESQVTL